MRQIRFRLGLGGLTAIPRTPWLDLRGLLLRGGRQGRENGGDGKGLRGGEGNGEREGKERSKERRSGGEGVGIAWSDLLLSLCDATATASDPVGS